jgi:dTDP-4-amino-4,6-dideoxygalactose transaminase
MRYKAFFDTVEDIDFFDEPDNCRSNFWLNTIILKDKEARDEFLQRSNDSGIMTRPVWTLMDKFPMFADCQTDDLTSSKWFEERVVNLPSSVRGKIV